MASDLPHLSADAMDAMSPDERLAAFRKRIITDLSDVSDGFREQVVETARRLARERRTAR